MQEAATFFFLPTAYRLLPTPYVPRGAGRAAPAGTTGRALGTGSGVASPSSTGSGLPLVSGANGSVNNPIRKIAHIVIALYRSGSDELGSPVANSLVKYAEKKLPPAAANRP